MLEAFADSAASVGLWTGFVVWTLLLVVANFGILIAMPGGWVALALAVVYDLFYGFESIGLRWLGVFAALLVVGEVIESLLGMVYVAKKGATRYGVIGGFVGGIGGAAIGSAIVPIVGTLVGSALGAFAGAVSGEYLRDQQVEPSLRIGMHATVGRLLATAVKFALSVTGTALVLRAAIPG